MPVPLTEGQWQVRDLVLGEGTVYRLVKGTSPLDLAVRADQASMRAWGHGSWSGAEWAAALAIPIRLLVEAADLAAAVTAIQQLKAAFAPVGDSTDDVELRYVLAGTEYVLFGRPRLVEPDVNLLKAGQSVVRCGFVATDPLHYSGETHSTSTGLPVTTGGLTLPFTLPFSIGATVSTGRVNLTNAGTAPVGLTLRINGPVQQPRVSLLTAVGTYTVSFFLDLGSGQFLDVDTAARTVYLQGTASRRGYTAASDLGWPILPPGTSELAFFASVYDAAALLDVSWRDAWF